MEPYYHKKEVPHLFLKVGILSHTLDTSVPRPRDNVITPKYPLTYHRQSNYVHVRLITSMNPNPVAAAA